MSSSLAIINLLHKKRRSSIIKQFIDVKISFLNEIPENILKNPAKTIFPNCPRKTRKHLKGNKGEKKRKGGEGEYASGVGPTNTSSDMDPMDTSDTSDMAPPSGMDPTNTSSDMAPLSIEGGKKDKKGKKEKK